MRQVDLLPKGLQNTRLHSRLVQTKHNAFTVQKPHNHFFPMAGRQHRNPQIDPPSAHNDGNLTVLRHTTFGNVKISHNLQTRDNCRMHFRRRLADFEQHSIDPIANFGVFFLRFNMNIAGPFPQSIAEDIVNKLYHR